MKINDAIDLFLEHLLVEKGLSKETISSYKQDLKQFFNYFKDIKNVEDLQPEHVNDFFSFQRSVGKSISTCLRRLSCLINFYSFLKKENYYLKEMPEIEKPKKETILPNCLSIEEVEKLLDAPLEHSDSGLRDKAMLETMYATGLRVSELLNLEINKVNLKKKIVTIFGKGAKERRVPIGEFACEYIEKYIDKVRNKNIGKSSKYLFLNKKGEKLSRVYFFKQVKKYAEYAGIKISISPHTLRHCFATHLLESNVSINVVQRMLGHENLSTTQIYTHISTKRVQSVYDLYMNKK